MKLYQKITARQIGELAGCSQQAVSAVLNGHGNSKVSMAKREKIFEIARNYNYQPNRIAQKLSGHATKTIGVIPGTSVFTAEAQESLSTSLRAYGYNAIFMPLVISYEEAAIVSQLLALGVDGIISFQQKGNFDSGKIGVPTILISFEQYDVDFDWVDGVRQLMEHLCIQHHHRRIGFLIDCHHYSVDQMLTSYSACQKKFGCDSDESWITALDWNEHFGEILLRQIREEHLTAYICSEDLMAGRLIIWLGQHGIRVPEDVAVVSCRGNIYGESVNPSLTSMIYPIDEICRRSAEMIVSKIDRRFLGRTASPLQIRSSIHLGHSCGCPVVPMDFIRRSGRPISYDKSYD